MMSRETERRLPSQSLKIPAVNIIRKIRPSTLTVDKPQIYLFELFLAKQFSLCSHMCTDVCLQFGNIARTQHAYFDLKAYVELLQTDIKELVFDRRRLWGVLALGFKQSHILHTYRFLNSS